jgi:DMSO/TMAO reductase YedYZ molybdopterin-dependent catalytic subunit
MPRNDFPMKTTGRVFHQVQPHELTEELSPEQKHYILCHIGVPQLAQAEWSLEVTGLVRKSLKFTYDELLRLPQTTMTAFQECAGSPMKPTAAVRRVNQIEWRGVALSTILDLAGVHDKARYLWASGADHGTYEATGVEVEEYQKDLPIEKALSAGVLLATHLNGKPLPEVRGGPVRLVVPGYYSTCSVKWLLRIEPRAERSSNYFAAVLYNDVVKQGNVDVRRPVWDIAPHSVIVAPAPSPAQHLGQAIEQVWGWAWGAREIMRVEVSTDGGVTWSDARLQPRTGWRWQRFQLPWRPVAGACYELACRATDDSGTVQPEAGARNEVFRTSVTVT